MIEHWFARPAWLLSLIPLAFYLWQCRRRPHAGSPWAGVVDAHLLPHLLQEQGGPAQRSLAMSALAGLCAVLALAGPRLPAAPDAQSAQRAATHVLVVDLSPAAAPRIERAKAKLNALLRTLDGAEVALVVYAQDPYLVVPPTADADVVARFIPELAADAVPVAGNRPGHALDMAAAVLERSTAPVRNIVWVSSGTGMLLSAPPAGMRLFILHGGDENGALANMAVRSGGMLQQMRTDDGDIQALAAALTARERPAYAYRSAGGPDIGFWFLIPLLPLAAIRFRHVIAVWIPIVPLMAIALAAMVAAPDAAAARLADVDAHRMFAEGRHDEAASRFADVRWRAAAHYRAGRFAETVRLLDGLDEPDAHYNRGNALAKLGHLQEALAAYEASLRLRPLDADTLHNRDLVRSLLRSGSSGNGGSGDGSGSNASQRERDAAQVAEQWLRSVPDEPATLLRRKLQLEHKRRNQPGTERAW